MGNNEIRLGKILINGELNLATKNGESLGLEPKWVQVLNVLASHVNKPVTREQIIQQVWADYIVGEDSLNRAISQIRKAISSEEYLKIETIRGIGYQLIFNDAGHTGQKETPVETRSLKPNIFWPVTLFVILLVAIAFIVFYPRDRETEGPGTLLEKVVTSDHGIEYAPAISPDNRYMAYLWNGGSGDRRKIYIKEIGGTNAIRFTEGANNDRSPAWSSEGTQLAYFKSVDKGLVLHTTPFLKYAPVALDSVRKIPEGINIDWSPEDDHLVYSAMTHGGLNFKVYKLDLETGERTVLLGSESDKTIHYTQPKYSPDGEQLVAIKRSKKGLSSPLGIRHVIPATLEVYNADMQSVDFRKDFDGALFSVEWKDDHTLVYVIESDNQFTVQELDLESGEIKDVHGTRQAIRELHYNRAEATLYLELWFGDVNIHKADYRPGKLENRERILSSSRYDWGPLLHPSGQSLAFFSTRSGRSQVLVHDLNTKETRQVSKFKEEYGLRTMAWGHNNDLLVISKLEERKNGHLIVMNTDGRILDSLNMANMSMANATWSEDDKSIYFIASDDSGLSNNWKYNLDTKALETVRIPRATHIWEKEGHLYYMLAENRGIWKAPLNNLDAATLVSRRLTPDRSKYWGMVGDTLMMINLYSYTNILEVVKLSTGELLDSLVIEGFIPSGEPGASFLNDKAVLFTVVDGLETEIVSLSER